MITDSHTQKNPDKDKARLYFRLALVSIFLLSLLWTVDASLAFCLLGSLIACTYLAILHYKRAHASSRHRNHYNNQPFESSESRAHNRARDNEREAFNYSSKHDSLFPKTIRYVVIGFFVVFSFFLIIGVFSASDSGSVESLYQQGELFYNEGTYDSAKIFYQKALRLEEDHQQAQFGYGNTLMALAQYDSAVIVYDKILEQEPDSESTLYQKGLALYYANKFDESINVMKDLVAENSFYHEAKQVIGDDFYNQKQYDSALMWYDQAYAGGLRNRYLCHLMGYIYDTKDSTARAASLYKEALEYDDSVVDIYIRLSELFPGAEGEAYRAKAKSLQAEN